MSADALLGAVAPPLVALALGVARVLVDEGGDALDVLLGEQLARTREALAMARERVEQLSSQRRRAGGRSERLTGLGAGLALALLRPVELRYSARAMSRSGRRRAIGIRGQAR